ncbi:uncharacterized protein TNCV_3013181 [Trichonephila clavipes]|nr:uncharacterized protein TNCV_3013181 [Trichonephila clavipes]
MDVCKCIVSSRHRGTLNSSRAGSPFVRLGVRDERWEAPDPPPGFRPQNWGGTELNRTVTCMVLKAMTNDRRASCHDKFHGPRSDYVRQVALAATTTKEPSVIRILRSKFLKWCK